MIYLTICGKDPAVQAAITRDQWPAWASALAKLSTDADAGVGDTAHRLLGVGGAVFSATLKAMGIPCGCAARRAEWNATYPYPAPSPADTILL